MFKKGMALCLTVFLVCIVIAAYAREKSPKRVLSERLIAQIDFSSWIQRSFTVSPDSQRVAYGAIVGDKQFVVVDGEEGKRYDGIGEGTLIFSPDSQHVAFMARVGDKRFVVLDGEEGKRYDGIGEGTLIFSPDSQRVAYGTIVGDKQFVVMDGEEGKRYDGIATSPIFSSDSQHVAYGAAVGDKQFVVVDGKEGKGYDGIVTIGGGRIIFDSPDSLHYLATKGASIYLVEERIK